MEQASLCARMRRGLCTLPTRSALVAAGVGAGSSARARRDRFSRSARRSDRLAASLVARSARPESVRVIRLRSARV